MAGDRSQERKRLGYLALIVTIFVLVGLPFFLSGTGQLNLNLLSLKEQTGTNEEPLLIPVVNQGQREVDSSEPSLEQQDLTRKISLTGVKEETGEATHIPLLNYKQKQGKSLEIINKQSRPRVNGKWIVKFRTRGKNDLKVTPVDGTGWSQTQGNFDLKFEDIRCGYRLVNSEAINWMNQGDSGQASLLIDSYSCPRTSYLTMKVLTTGKHHLKIQFGDEVAYAHNLANCTGTNVTPCHQCNIDNAEATLRSPSGTTQDYTGFSWETQTGGCSSSNPKWEYWSADAGSNFCPDQGQYEIKAKVHAEGDPWEWEESGWRNFYICNCDSNTADPGGSAWLDGDYLHWVDDGSKECWTKGQSGGATSDPPGSWWIEGDYMYWVTAGGTERRYKGFIYNSAPGEPSGAVWIENEDIHYVDTSGVEREVNGITD